MRSLKDGIDGSHSILPFETLKQIYLFYLKFFLVLCFPAVFHFTYFVSYPTLSSSSLSRLCPFLTDLFLPRIPSLPLPHSIIYCTSSVATHPPHCQSLLAFPIFSYSLLFLHLPLIPSFSSAVNSQAPFLPRRRWFNYFSRLWTEWRSHLADLMDLSCG